MGGTLRVLIVEESARDAQVLVHALARGGTAPTSRRVSTPDGLRAALADGTWDVVLCDPATPGLDALSALALVNQTQRNTPFIVVNGTIGEDAAVALMRAGAHDCVRKDDGARLVPAVRRELCEAATRRRRGRDQQALAERERTLQAMLASIGDTMSMMDRELTILWANDVAKGAFGADMVGRKCYEAYHGRTEPCDPQPCICVQALADGRVHEHETSVVGADGHTLHSHCTANVALRDDQGNPCAVTEISRDITQRKQVENRLRLLATAVEQAGDAVAITDTEGTIDYVNPAFGRITGYTPSEVVGQNIGLLRSERHHGALERQIREALGAGRTWTGRLTHRKKDGTHYEADATVSPVRDQTGVVTHYVLVQRDATRQHDLEEQLRQSQKMEAVGQLAGGVAHDFNNIVTGILGLTDLLAEQLDDRAEALQDLAEIQKLGERAAKLTHQLMAFSRRQPLEPRALDLNELVSDSSVMLRRLIGEDVAFTAPAAPELGHVHADPGQIEQVLMNLVLNARDAMPDGGTLEIQTADVMLGREMNGDHVWVEPGPYVMLAVTDTGCGMEKDTCRRVFEPFFTTKEAGRGTGLGLATVYGIVRQHHGYIHASSKVGHGTTFRVYLPRADAPLGEPARTVLGQSRANGTETILVVEDDDPLRALVGRILEAWGYRVLLAASADEAETFFSGDDSGIRLLLTDIVMPGRSGRDLYRCLSERFPSLKVVFMSGYTQRVALTGDLSPSGGDYIGKPFTPEALARQVREALDRPRPV